MRFGIRQLRLQLSLVLIVTLASCAQTQNSVKPAQPSQGKALRGSAGASGGAASYRIPIELPDGDGAPRPSVDVVYGSRSGVGLLGMGWTLAAGGSVHRCPFIPDGDGIAREVLFKPDDRLCIDGTKMVLLKGEYGKEGSLYLAEINPGGVVRLYGDLDSPKSAFGFFDNAGNFDLYGARETGEGASVPTSWLITASVRKGGSAVEYVYDDRRSGDIALAGILYGSTYSTTDKTVTHGRYFVRFGYAPRDTIATSFLSGAETRYTRLITSITTGTRDANGADDVFRNYAFTYRPSLSTGRPLLVSAQACKDVAMQTDCTLATHFDWQDAPLAFTSPEPIAAQPPGDVIAAEWHPGDRAPALTAFSSGGDYNADGRRELVVRSAAGQARVFVLEPGRRVVAQADVPREMQLGGFDVSSGPEIRQVGSAEIVGGVDGRLAVLDWLGTGFAAPAATSIPYTGDIVLLDVTGDGLSDVVSGRHANGEYTLTLYRNEGSSDKTLALSAGEVVARFKDTPRLHLGKRTSLDGTGRTVIVRDGEDLAHVVRFSTDNDRKLRVDTVAPADIGISAEALARGFLFADVNGDGYDDIVYTSAGGAWQIQVNTGFHYDAPFDTRVQDTRSAVGRAGTLVFDIDSDGRSDIVFPARRLTDFCVKQSDAEPLCGDRLAAADPRMDLGIYAYDAIDFQQDAAAQYVVRVRHDLNLIGQANRAAPADIFGDGYFYLLSPFDRGIANGGFKTEAGSLAECPPTFGCGLRVAQRAHIKRDDRSDAPLDYLLGVESAPGTRTKWTYYPISNPFRHLYSVPALGSPERYIDSQHYYFTSSMYVVGEMAVHDAQIDDVVRFDYGAAQYNTAGRGFDGFKWIIVHDEAEKRKYGSWFRQDGPYRGMQTYSWTEDEGDTENDYFHGSPGKRSLSYEKIGLGCAGPKDDALTLRYDCKPEDSPAFRVFKTK